MKIRRLTNKKTMTREDWIARVLELAPGAKECTPARRDAGYSVVFRLRDIEVDARWDQDVSDLVAKALRGEYNPRDEETLGTIEAKRDANYSVPPRSR